MRYVYLNQEGLLGDYAKPLRRNSKTGFKRVQGLQIALEQTIRHYSRLSATEDNSRALWESLYTIFTTAEQGMTKNEVECDAFNEIKFWVKEIGRSIAHVSRRTGISNYVYKEEVTAFLNSDPNSPYFIERFLRAAVCLASNGFSSVKAEETAEYLFYKINRMGDEELLKMANKWHDDLLSFTQRRISRTSESVEIPF